MDLSTVLTAIPFYRQDKEGNPTITSIENDHRLVSDGSIFICIKGYTFDGHNAAKEAVEKGAVAIIAEQPVDVSVPVIYVRSTKRAMAQLAAHFYGHPTESFHLIGITGTNGKTTTSHLIDEILRASGETTGLIGTMYMKIGDETVETKNTTPESLTLQKTFSKMKTAGVSAAVMEVSSHALQEGRTNGTQFNVAVFTNLTQDHLDFHRTMDEYRTAKGLLFSRLGSSFHSSTPTFAILNADDKASQVYEAMTAAHVVTYGLEQDADIQAKEIQLTSAGTAFTIHYPGGMIGIKSKLAGLFNVYNILAAFAAGFVSNVAPETMKHALERVVGVAGRFEMVSNDKGVSVIVDYAHTPDSLVNVLETVRPLTKGRVIAIVGCGGDRDKTKRPLMAQAACEHADEAIFTSDNPRSEDPAAILADMESGVVGQEYTIIEDRKEAIHRAIKFAQPGDSVVIAGKGHETYQIIGRTVLHFDDREVAKEALADKKGGFA
ncbi:UDP-N-acetylmuramoyl-L-alanyl-D-glutamate--2,6-diaminopimelate ligase [Domibacillus epiphyticus]|uniref:UDP-N-acetylmuramoyl-L-alanyl-D-glutamate--2,6-diaminopimelate ligase n=1 Tax=Domibacillus epiphyticus TaxID=1714355 RepID=A0A1V2ABY9_9BACI|nr:UDP-N-acetylmuramoyl-L-alanyl-D-glutamate--2,6-diaminopimelate ligase [Domibacillus epiphyticus]OMP68518.1 UDP-N-acetylmuramoyl-L-alanyl-D-glutamate--2,6-diaminopimelate ligase [Domibacillus epiphyticus]